MLAVRDKSVIQIEVTNACANECTNCSRFVGHYRKTYFMTLEQVEKAIDSLHDFPGCIGIMGGEPLLHPDFQQICHLVKRMLPPEKRFLWTSGHNWEKYSKVIRKTFGENVHFNNHRDTTQKHHPMLLAINDVIEDKELIRKLVDDCWVNRKWSASVNPKGSFFCEIAAAMDVLFDGPGGHPVAHGWWDKGPDEFQDQIERYCYQCGACVPYSPVTLDDMDVASISNYQRLREVASPKLLENGINLHNELLSQQQLDELATKWQPWRHLGVMEKEGSGENFCDMYGNLYGYAVKIRKTIRSRFWLFSRVETAIGRWMWRMQQTLRTAKTKTEAEKSFDLDPC